MTFLFRTIESWDQNLIFWLYQALLGFTGLDSRRRGSVGALDLQNEADLRQHEI